MLSNLTILFPLAVALYALLWCCRWAAIHRQAVPALQRAARAEQTAAGHTGCSRWADVPRGFTRQDWILLGALTAVYAVVAFAGLGSTAVPQNYLHFEQANTYAQIELKEPQTISAVRYWSGLNTADYLLQFSPDGENWIDQVKEDGTSGSSTHSCFAGTTRCLTPTTARCGMCASPPAGQSIWARWCSTGPTDRPSLRSS